MRLNGINIKISKKRKKGKSRKVGRGGTENIG
jgi:hypothetical protein